jgi:GNAT superfamily N-acetyltransferase
MMAAPSLRLMEPADREAVIDLLWSLNRMEAEVGAVRRIDRFAAIRCLDFDEDAVRQSCGQLVVAEAAGVIIGYIAMSQREGGPYLPDRLLGQLYIENIVVDPAHRSGGVGAMLLAEAERFARAKGLGALALGVVMGNTRAQNFYGREGFKPAAFEMVKALD